MNCLANWTINRRSFLFNAALAATAAGGTLTPLARAVAAETMDEVRRAMRINYFDDEELIRSQAERFAKK